MLFPFPDDPIEVGANRRPGGAVLLREHAPQGAAVRRGEVLFHHVVLRETGAERRRGRRAHYYSYRGGVDTAGEKRADKYWGSGSQTTTRGRNPAPRRSGRCASARRCSRRECASTCCVWCTRRSGRRASRSARTRILRNEPCWRRIGGGWTSSRGRLGAGTRGGLARIGSAMGSERGGAVRERLGGLEVRWF